MGEKETPASPSHLPDKCSAPWVVYTHGKRGVNKSQTFFSITASRFYVRSIKELRQNHCVIASFGWLLLFMKRRCFLWNPVTMAKFKLPMLQDHLVKSRDISKCLLSSPPNHPDCMVMCYNCVDQYVIFCRRGDEKWIYYHPIDICIRTVVSCGGKFYGIDVDRKLVIFNFDPHPRITLLDIAEPGPARLGIHEEALFEFCGEIFLVDKFLINFSLNTGDIQVLKLDLSKRRWDEVDDIGNIVVFLNRYGCSVALPASDLGVKKGCIYLTEFDDKHLYVYDMEEGTLSRSLPCPNIKGELTMRPFFIIPPVL